MERNRGADRIRARRVVVEVRIERTTIRVVVVVATDIREIRRVDIPIVGEETPNNTARPTRGLPYRLPQMVRILGKSHHA